VAVSRLHDSRGPCRLLSGGSRTTQSNTGGTVSEDPCGNTGKSRVRWTNKP